MVECQLIVTQLGNAYVHRNSLAGLDEKVVEYSTAKGSWLVKTGTPGTGKTISRNEDVRNIINAFVEDKNIKTTVIMLDNSPGSLKVEAILLRRGTVGSNSSLRYGVLNWPTKRDCLDYIQGLNSYPFLHGINCAVCVPPFTTPVQGYLRIIILFSGCNAG